MSDKPILTSQDVARLLQDPNEENRVEAATKVAASFSGMGLSDKERGIAEDIFRVMVRDAAVRVRQALSESLASDDQLPHDVARKLAQDVDQVALPVIENSVVLTDEDLISIVQTRGVQVQQAVARRDGLSGEVADALVETDNEDVVATLVKNSSANIGEETFQKVLEKFPESERVKSPIVHRGELPISVAERLVAMVSEKLRDHIMMKHEISATMASDLVMASREKATVSLLKGTGRSAVLELIEQLYRNGRLTPTLIIRALCRGDATFFEAALARMVGIPVSNAYKLIHSGGDLGLQKLFEKANVPKQFFNLAKIGLDVAAESLAMAGDDRKLYEQLVIERILTRMADMDTGENGAEEESIDYLIGKLTRISAPPAREANA